MFQASVILAPPVPAGHRPELERRLQFALPDVTDFSLVARDGEVVEIVVRSDLPLEIDTLGAKVRHLVDHEVRTQRVAPSKVIWESTADRPGDPGTFARLVAEGAVFELGEGQVALAEPLLSLFRYFDAALRRMVVDHFHGQEMRYPALIPTRVLERCGYLNAFPHHLMLVTRLHNDLDVYRAFLADYQERGGLDTSVLQACRNVDYCLPPTVCFHTYGQYQGSELAPGEQRVVTARGKSFRFESRYARSLERLWDFTIREVVFMGPRAFVVESRQRLMRLTFDYLAALGLSGVCQVANDPFFQDAEASGRIWTQRLREAKYELQLHVDGERDIAVGSFNLHDDFFGRSFEIRQGPDWINTACAGFGLERLVFAFVCQFGLDRSRWPPLVRTAITADHQGG